jgi:hypothetical protein
MGQAFFCTALFCFLFTLYLPLPCGGFVPAWMPNVVGVIPFLTIRQHNKPLVIQSRVASPKWLPGLFMLEVRSLQKLVLSVCLR